MPNTDQGALPGVPGATIAEQCLERMRALFSAQKPDPGEKLWRLLNHGERRAIVRRAKLEADLAGLQWNALSPEAHAAIRLAWSRLRDRVIFLDVQIGR